MSNKETQCPNLCDKGKVKYYVNPNISLFDLINCRFCKGKGTVHESKITDIEKQI